MGRMNSLREWMSSFGTDGWMNRMKNSENLKEDEVLERNKNLNRGFRKLRVWREAVELYVFVKFEKNENRARMEF